MTIAEAVPSHGVNYCRKGIRDGSSSDWEMIGSNIYVPTKLEAFVVEEERARFLVLVVPCQTSEMFCGDYGIKRGGCQKRSGKM